MARDEGLSFWDAIQVKVLRFVAEFCQQRLRTLDEAGSPADSAAHEATRDIDVLAIEMWKVIQLTADDVTVRDLNDAVCRRLNISWSEGSQNHRRLFAARQALRYGAGAIESTSLWAQSSEGPADTYRRSPAAGSLTEQAVLAGVRANLSRPRAVTGNGDWQYDHRRWCWVTLSVIRDLESLHGPVQSKAVREAVADRLELTAVARNVGSLQNRTEREYSARCATMRDLLVRMNLIERLPGARWHVLSAGHVAKDDEDFNRLVDEFAADLGGTPNGSYRGNSALEQKQAAAPAASPQRDIDRELRQIVFDAVARLAPADTRAVNSAVETEVAQTIPANLYAPAVLQLKQQMTRGALVKAGLIECGAADSDSHADHSWRITAAGEVVQRDESEDAVETAYQSWRRQVPVEEIASLASEFASAARPPSASVTTDAAGDEDLLPASGVEAGDSETIKVPAASGASSGDYRRPLPDLLSLPRDEDVALALLNSLQPNGETRVDALRGKARTWLKNHTAHDDDPYYEWTRPGNSPGQTEYAYRVEKLLEALVGMGFVEVVDEDGSAWRLTSDGAEVRDSDEGVPDEDLGAQLAGVKYEPRSWQDAAIATLLDSKRGVDPKGFERFTQELLSHRYLQVRLNDTRYESGGDGGYDGTFSLPDSRNAKGLFECKRWEGGYIGVRELGRFMSALRQEQAVLGLFVSTAKFSSDVVREAREHNAGHERVRLVGPEELCQLMRQHDFGIVTQDGRVMAIDQSKISEYRDEE